MTDHHVHIGQFNEVYYDSHEVFEAISANAERFGINEVLYSSTSSCRYDVELFRIEEEIEYAQKFSSSVLKVQPYFWLVPKYAEENVDFEKAMEKFDYCGFKIHPISHKWNLRNVNQVKMLEKAFSYAQENNLSVLIHSGKEKCCRPERFEKFFDEFENLKFVLAHSAPISAASKMTAKHKNVFCDTAFCEEKYVRKVMEKIPKERILFGTDFPITHYWSEKKVSLAEQYKKDCEILNLLKK